MIPEAGLSDNYPMPGLSRTVQPLPEAEPRFAGPFAIHCCFSMSPDASIGVCVRRELVFPCDNIVNVINIRSCLRRNALRCLGSKGKPDFGE